VVEAYPNPKDATVIRVVAEQFTWNARYPGPDGQFGVQDPKFVDPASNKFGYDPNDPAGKDDITPPLKEIHVPVDKPVLIHLSSLDVIHSLAIQSLRVCQDAIPGLSIPVHFVPTLTNTYRITCAQLCGNSHYSMDGYFTVDSMENYEKWLAEKASSGAATGGFE
jgi:cytochrome c oxidase subunit 2